MLTIRQKLNFICVGIVKVCMCVYVCIYILSVYDIFYIYIPTLKHTYVCVHRSVAPVLVYCKHAKFKFDYKMIYDQAKQQQEQQQNRRQLCNCNMQKKYHQTVRYAKGNKTTVYTDFCLYKKEVCKKFVWWSLNKTTVRKIQLPLCCIVHMSYVYIHFSLGRIFTASNSGTLYICNI